MKLSVLKGRGMLIATRFMAWLNSREIYSPARDGRNCRPLLDLHLFSTCKRRQIIVFHLNINLFFFHKAENLCFFLSQFTTTGLNFGSISKEDKKMENHINATLSVADRDAVINAVAQIRTLLPFLIDLSPDERQALPKMGDKSRAFVQQALQLAEHNDAYLTRFTRL